MGQTSDELANAADGKPIFNTADVGAVRLSIDSEGFHVGSFLGANGTGQVEPAGW